MARKSKIELSPHKSQIEEMILSGKSPRDISKWLKKKGEEISKKAIERYRETHIPEVKMIHPSILQKRLEGIDKKLSDMDILMDIILIQLLRVDKGLDNEDEEGKLIPVVSKEIDRAWGYIQDRIKLLQDLGLMPSRDITNTPLPSTEVNIYNANSNNTLNQPTTLKELLQNVEPERRRNLIGNIGDALRKVRETNRE